MTTVLKSIAITASAKNPSPIDARVWLAGFRNRLPSELFSLLTESAVRVGDPRA
jgi:hypothetical protein